MKGVVKTLEAELRQEKLRDAEAKFHAATQEHRVRQHALMDMEKYHKALTYAITKFHKVSNREIIICHLT